MNGNIPSTPVHLPRKRQMAIETGSLDAGLESPDLLKLLARMRAVQLRTRIDLGRMKARVDRSSVRERTRSRSASGAASPATPSVQRQPGLSTQLHRLDHACPPRIHPFPTSSLAEFRYSDAGQGPEPGQRRLRFEWMGPGPDRHVGELLVEESTGRILEERSHRSALPGLVSAVSCIRNYGEIVPGLWHEIEVRTIEHWNTPEGETMIQRHTSLRPSRWQGDSPD